MSARTKKAPKPQTKRATAAAGRTELRFKPTISERELYGILGPGNPLVKRLLNADSAERAWLDVVEEAEAGGEDGRIVDYRSFRRAYRRLIKGERPPPLPGGIKVPELLLGQSGAPAEVAAAVLRLMTLLPRLGQEVSISVGTKSFVVHWSDGTTEIYKAVRNRRGGKKGLALKTYEAVTLSLVDKLWAAEKGPESGK